MPLWEPIAHQRSPPKSLQPWPFPPRPTTVMPTPPSSVHLATTRRSERLYSTTSPPFPTTSIPSPSPHHSKSPTPFPPLTLHSAIHCVDRASRILITPPPFLALPTSPIHRPHGLSLKRSIVRWESWWPQIRVTFCTVPGLRSQI